MSEVDGVVVFFVVGLVLCCVYWDDLCLMYLAFRQISVPSSSCIRKLLLIPSSDGISWMISPVVSHIDV